MDRWVIRKVDVKETSDINQETEEVDNNVVTTPCQSDMKRSVVEPSSSGQPQPKRRKYQEDFIQYGFVCHVVNDVHHRQCVICLEVLANESLRPAKMKRHLQCKHQSLKNKPIDRFFPTQENGVTRTKASDNKKMLHCLSKLKWHHMRLHILLLRKKKKTHTIGEELIKPAALAMCRAIHGGKMARELESIPLSNNTVGRRIHETASDILIQLMERVKNVNYALQ
ncbi:zinc finger BED domain-containing protein 5-like [Macrobrachium nipponense]|uniref:zinc finger BED domain-containing protein 5-like n=1 Tax=Macrobrachium nipponense TaxID=159736 RepID=UPI0030C85E01